MCSTPYSLPVVSPSQISSIWRIEDGKVIEHWSVRDDLGQALQLGLISG
jgi:predicted SnoaL-like aldol condensation-catalyzing enzyme